MILFEKQQVYYIIPKQIYQNSKPKSITMNSTSYWSERQNSFRSHLRRNSLQTLNKLKHNSSHQQQQPYRKSLTSFDKITKTQRNELPQIRYQKQMDNNIYFNPQSRNNFFRNLIDSYFDKNQHKSTKNAQNAVKPSYLLRRSVLNKKSTLKDLGQNIQKPKDKSHMVSLVAQNQPTKQTHSIFPKQKIIKRSYLKHQTLLKPKANLQKMPSLQQKDQMIDFVQSGSLTTKPNNFPHHPFNQQQSYLRKITQAIDDEDFDQEAEVNSRNQLLNRTFLRSQSNFSRLQDKKVLMYQNSVIKLYTSCQNDKKYRIKQFKNSIFLKRHNRALQSGAYSFWKSYQFNQMSLIIPYIFPLKDYLFKLLPHPTSPDYYIIQPKPFYYRMTANHCQELFLLFREFIKDIHKISRKVLNNKINLSNLFYINGKFCLGEWEYSAFKEENKIQGNHFESRVEPILKCDKEWLVSPEYLAPQILESIEEPHKPFDLWEYQNASDIYSIGLTFLQIITLIPMWMHQKASIKSKIMKPRDGFLSTTNRSSVRILEKQKLLVPKMTTFLERQVGQEEKNWAFFNILIKMIEPNRGQRITIDQLIKQIQRIQKPYLSIKEQVYQRIY